MNAYYYSFCCVSAKIRKNCGMMLVFRKYLFMLGGYSFTKCGKLGSPRCGAWAKPS